MLFSEKKEFLVKEITNKLSTIITADYWLLGLPYYTNIGDILIWEGTEQFLTGLNIYCKNKSTENTFRHKSIKSNTIILLQGGGNFGDLWENHQEFRRKIITKYPDNKIIILPQTVYYSDKNKLIDDAKLFSRHKNITICARDNNSYETLKRYFSANTILLVPDMAFCIPNDRLSKFQSKQENKALFLKRTDKELSSEIDYTKHISEKQYGVHDWPSMEKEIASVYILHKFFGINRRIPQSAKLTDKYASIFFKSNMIKTGVRFLAKYNKVYTTRLHAAILCCLLEKPCTFFR